MPLPSFSTTARQGSDVVRSRPRPHRCPTVPFASGPASDRSCRLWMLRSRRERPACRCMGSGVSERSKNLARPAEAVLNRGSPPGSHRLGKQKMGSGSCAGCEMLPGPLRRPANLFGDNPEIGPGLQLGGRLASPGNGIPGRGLKLDLLKHFRHQATQRPCPLLWAQHWGTPSHCWPWRPL